MVCHRSHRVVFLVRIECSRNWFFRGLVRGNIWRYKSDLIKTLSGGELMSLLGKLAWQARQRDVTFSQIDEAILYKMMTAANRRIEVGELRPGIDNKFWAFSQSGGGKRRSRKYSVLRTTPSRVAPGECVAANNPGLSEVFSDEPCSNLNRFNELDLLCQLRIWRGEG